VSTNRPGHAPVPNDLPQDPRIAGFTSQKDSPTARFSPNKLFLDLFSRVNEAMAAGVDALPAYMALSPALYALGRGDAQFARDMARVRARCKLMYDTLGHMSRNVWVMWHMEPMYAFAIRRGVLKLEPAGFLDDKGRPVSSIARAAEEATG